MENSVDSNFSTNEVYALLSKAEELEGNHLFKSICGKTVGGADKRRWTHPGDGI